MNDLSLNLSVSLKLAGAVGFLLGVLATFGYLRMRNRVLFLAQSARVTLAHRALLAKARTDFLARKKAPIAKVGGLVKMPDGTDGPDEAWEFEGGHFVYWGPDGQCCHSGWTHAELAEVAKQRKEFAP